MLYIGPHMTTAKGYTRAAKDIIEMEANVFQFFSRNPRGSNFRAYNEKDVNEFQKLRKEYKFGPLQAHAPYTMNLGSSDEGVYEFGRTVIKEDIHRMNDLGIEFFVFHPGSHTGSGIEASINQIANALNESIKGDEKIKILLETMPGKGTEVGFRFEHLKSIIDKISYKDKIGVCMDLCHVFSAGYDIKNNIYEVMEEFDKIIGIEKLKTIHLNDSLMPFGERKDRHVPVGEGNIGLDSIIKIMEHPYIKTLPFYAETPLDNEGHKREIKMIKEKLNYF
ncbi:putative endonuclease 4 [compost metagenome]